MKKCAKTGVRTWDSYLLGKDVFVCAISIVQLFCHCSNLPASFSFNFDCSCLQWNDNDDDLHFLHLQTMKQTAASKDDANDDLQLFAFPLKRNTILDCEPLRQNNLQIKSRLRLKSVHQ